MFYINSSCHTVACRCSIKRILLYLYLQTMALSDCGWTCGCGGKTVKSLENTCHTGALLRWWFTTKRRYIKCMHLYLYLLEIFSWPTCDRSTEFCGSRLCSFCVFLLTSTKSDEVTTSFAEVIRIARVFYLQKQHRGDRVLHVYQKPSWQNCRVAATYVRTNKMSVSKTETL